MKVLFVAPRWDYGDATRGDSFEYTNLFLSLSHMDGIDARFFDFVDDHGRGGSALVATNLRAAVDEFGPDLVFTMLFEDEVPAEVLVEMRDRPDVVTYNWFCDDHWRFDDFSSRYAPLFNFVSTTARSALPKYEQAGIDHVLKTQWACNHHLYRPSSQPPHLGVTFIGQPHGDRRWTVRRLARHGVNVSTWGHGWTNGRLDQDEMITTFALSHVNLNLSNASQNPNVPALARKVLNRVYPPALRLWPAGRLEQIKGRNFEIPGCRGFQISGWADDIESYFEPDREIVLYRSHDELIEQVRRYAGDDAARTRIAEAGFRRTVAEHTYEHRFRDLFAAMGLGRPVPAKARRS